ncbi:hypothetical protein LCGC14_3151120 [marine sediment metagenome]|uniref:Uncharacterized protein n=1 Tax=marine sediment metagenome TaxID=412755 RepID=A0A0F8YIH2_9ZZZZ
MLDVCVLLGSGKAFRGLPLLPIVGIAPFILYTVVRKVEQEEKGE